MGAPIRERRIRGGEVELIDAELYVVAEACARLVAGLEALVRQSAPERRVR